jgi:pyruvate/2-oxoglutarate dehydrogenase complex dihydrolipoamide dehydrogenase (E3) component
MELCGNRHKAAPTVDGGATMVEESTGRQVPFCLFTDPEFAHIGLSEKEAKVQAVAY